jgi:VIT1/CCC1 family predicted Fe2+/Mn2+ transporter
MTPDDEHHQTEANSAEIVFFLFRSSFAFVLGVIFLLLPLAIADTGKPWHFWVGSSLAAFALGAVLFYVRLRRLRTTKKGTR